MQDDAQPPTIHASCVAIGTAGVLIRGSSGTGKSALALQLMLDAPRALPLARLVADDRVHLKTHGPLLMASAPPILSGLLEVRGLGLRRFPFQAEVALTHLIDLGHDGPRLPDEQTGQIMLSGIKLQHIVSACPERAALMLAAALSGADYGD
ncbi:HPr kinase/phosphorylase [Xanthobacter sp. TB0136]|uniref:HPr kinase/phosphorylase n=1 Tax=Xanthobacter sp. TB0136 TaxID=3459177 RepID=UPI004039293A